jgi:hypothetical protein
MTFSHKPWVHPKVVLLRNGLTMQILRLSSTVVPQICRNRILLWGYVQGMSPKTVSVPGSSHTFSLRRDRHEVRAFIVETAVGAAGMS